MKNEKELIEYFAKALSSAKKDVDRFSGAGAHYAAGVKTILEEFFKITEIDPDSVLKKKYEIGMYKSKEDYQTYILKVEAFTLEDAINEAKQTLAKIGYFGNLTAEEVLAKNLIRVKYAKEV